MKRYLLTLLCASALVAQETTATVIQLRHIDPDNVRSVIDTLASNKARWSTDSRLRIATISGPTDLVGAIEAAIKKLDIPTPATKNVELTFHMLLASPQGESPAIAPELAGVAQQLRNVFGLKSVRILETAVLRGREGKGGETQGIMSAPVKVDTPATYMLRYINSAVSAGEKGSSIRIDVLRFNARIPIANAGGGIQFYEASFSTDVDIREGQKVVVGKSSIDSASQSIFLVVSAKVVD